jgi:hypothetical protein
LQGSRRCMRTSGGPRPCINAMAAE